MRFAIHFLLAACLMWCGLHAAEPVQAHAADAATLATGMPGDCGENGEEQGPGHLHHHHCPVAPAPRTAADDANPAASAGLLFPGPTVMLHSLSRAPPLEPPAA